MKENGLLGDNVNIEELAHLSKNFSGAEIEGLVKSAASFALFEGTSMSAIAPLKDLGSAVKKVEMKHFV